MKGFTYFTGMKNSIAQCYILMTAVSIFLQACVPAGKPGYTDTLLTEKDLIPEGLTVDDSTGAVYISSTYKRKIVVLDKKGNATDFIPASSNNIKSVVGMEADSRRGVLWAVSSEAAEVLPLKDPGTRQWQSSVFCFRLQHGEFLKEYPLHRDSIFLNDITVGKGGRVFVTETRNSSIYTIAESGDSLTQWLSPYPYTFLNGICFNDDFTSLFISCAEGILVADPLTRRVKLLAAAPGVNTKDIDGLSFYQGALIGHQSTKVSRFYLNNTGNTITHAALLNTDRTFDGSTTGEPAGDNYIFIVNSQIQSGIDFKKQAVKPADSLEPVIIRKISLNK